MEEKTRKFWITFALAITPPIGWVGAHRFYIGQRFRGLIYILFFWTGLPPVISVIDAALLLYRGQDVFSEKHIRDEEESDEEESDEEVSDEEESDEEESDEEESDEEESDEEELYKGVDKRSIEPDYSDYYGDF